MLIFGIIGLAMGFSIAWIANPLLLFAFIAIAIWPNPWQLRWFVFLAVVAMFSSIEFLSEIEPSMLAFFGLWVAAGLVLSTGLVAFRREWKREGRVRA